MNPSTHDPTQHALAILRICLWFIPGFMLAIVLFVSLNFRISTLWGLAILPVAFFLIGYFDMQLKLQIEKTNSTPIRIRTITWAIAFASIQIIIAPAVLILMILCLRIFEQIVGII